MVTHWFRILLFMVFSALSIPSIGAYTRLCNDLSPECLAISLQTAIPSFVNGSSEYGLETLDPYIMTKLDLSLPEGINIEFRDGYCTGLKSCLVDFARFNGDTLETQFHCNLTIKGKYRSSGRLLMFYIDGEGDSKIMCKNIKIHSVLKFGSKLKSDGQKYLEIKQSKINHSYDGRVFFFMTNLFKRSPDISRAVVQFMNDNWKMVAEEFGDPIVEYGVASVMRNIRKLLDIVPLEQIIDEPIDI